MPLGAATKSKDVSTELMPDTESKVFVFEGEAMSQSSPIKSVCLLFLVSAITACSKPDKVEAPAFNTKPLEDRVTKLENRVSILEAQAAQIPTKAASTETWVLWTRLDYLPGAAPRFGAGPVPFKPISAFDGRSSCMEGANNQVTPGGTYVSRDPLVVDYPDGRREFSCLPKGVEAGFHYAK